MPTYNAHADAERLLRQVWQDETGGIPIPVDPIQIARRLGIKVFESYLDEDVSGLLVKEVGRDPSIVLNAADSANRKRFTCAHEVGHFLRHGEDEYQYVDKRDAFASAGIGPEEMFANSFAAALLMPAAHVERLNDQGYKDYEMAVTFQVSREAMGHRLRNLGLQ